MMLRDEDIDPTSTDTAIADLFERSRLLVGELHAGRFWVRGRGATWEAAFADADARALRASRRKASR